MRGGESHTGPFYTPGSSASGPAQEVLVVPEWTLFTGDFIEGTSPLDLNNLTTTGTAYDPSTGLIRFVTSATNTTTVGYRSNLARFSFSVPSLLPDWDPTTEEFSVCLKVVAHPTTSKRYGVGVGLLDQPSSGAATCNGTYHCAGGVNNNAWWSYRFAPASIGSFTGEVAMPFAMAVSRQIADNLTGGTTRVMSTVNILNFPDDPVWRTPSLGTLPAANTHVHVGLHADNVAGGFAGEVWDCELYYRVIPRGPMDPL